MSRSKSREKQKTISENLANFIRITYGESEELLINPNCMNTVFMDYLCAKCEYNRSALIDLIDEDGNLANIHCRPPKANIHEVFDDRCTYIPVMLERSDDKSLPLKKIRPLLTDWEKKFPQLERKIKILTGEIKKTKPGGTKGNSLDLPGRSSRGIDRKMSKEKQGDRSQTGIGRPSISRSGRISVSQLVTKAQTVKGKLKAKKK